MWPHQEELGSEPRQVWLAALCSLLRGVVSQRSPHFNTNLVVWSSVQRLCDSHSALGPVPSTT